MKIYNNPIVAKDRYYINKPQITLLDKVNSKPRRRKK